MLTSDGVTATRNDSPGLKNAPVHLNVTASALTQTPLIGDSSVTARGALVPTQAVGVGVPTSMCSGVWAGAGGCEVGAGRAGAGEAVARSGVAVTGDMAGAGAGSVGMLVNSSGADVAGIGAGAVLGKPRRSRPRSIKTKPPTTINMARSEPSRPKTDRPLP